MIVLTTGPPRNSLGSSKRWDTYWLSTGRCLKDFATSISCKMNLKKEACPGGICHCPLQTCCYCRCWWPCSGGGREPRARWGLRRTTSCRMERGNVKNNFMSNQLSLHVTALTHTPDILISGTLVSGRPGNLTCSVPWACERGTPPIFSWKGATVSSQVLTTSLSSVLTLTPRPQDHGTKLTCQVTLPGAEVTTARVVRLNVSCESWARTPGPSTELDCDCLPRKQHSIHSPGKRILSFSLGGPVPAPGLRRRQQPPRQDQLGPGEPDPPRLAAQPPGGAGAATGARGRRRGVHLPRSARPGLPARLPEALAAEAVSAPGKGGPGSHLGSGCQDSAPPPLSPGPPSEALHKEVSQAGRGRVRGKGNPVFNPSGSPTFLLSTAHLEARLLPVVTLVLPAASSLP
ncbi:uncharacterized protein LOC121816380 isoform X8 [Ovis aries]|uniref:uncharacterized protein LOC121816380 isoform X8 n=1 Tax=Ovis aries TaxID=9940 RepID=UPI0029528347|nr:uncharacterized protein LOC121816380 isoform X8 [Ovis aries]